VLKLSKVEEQRRMHTPERDVEKSAKKRKRSKHDSIYETPRKAGPSSKRIQRVGKLAYSPDNARAVYADSGDDDDDHMNSPVPSSDPGEEDITHLTGKKSRRLVWLLSL
jgi:hypothetical protein